MGATKMKLASFVLVLATVGLMTPQQAWSNHVNPPGRVGGPGHGRYWHYNAAGARGGPGRGWVYNPPGPGRYYYRTGSGVNVARGAGCSGH